jgi:hypothetical protein
VDTGFCNRLDVATAGAGSPDGERLDVGKVRRRVRPEHADLRCGLLLVELRGILLCVLCGAIAGLLQVLVAHRLLLGEHQRQWPFFEAQLGSYPERSGWSFRSGDRDTKCFDHSENTRCGHFLLPPK